MLGREIQLPLDVMVGNLPNVTPDLCPVSYVEWLRRVMQENFELANEHLGNAAKTHKRNYDINLKLREF